MADYPYSNDQLDAPARGDVIVFIFPGSSE